MALFWVGLNVAIQKGSPCQASVCLSVKLVIPLCLVRPLRGQVGRETLQDSEAILSVMLRPLISPHELLQLSQQLFLHSHPCGVAERGVFPVLTDSFLGHGRPYSPP